MPSPKTNDCGMLTFHPTTEEYEQYRGWFLVDAVWSRFFSSYAIIEEKNSHLHIPFSTIYEEIGTKRERFEKKLMDFIVGTYKNKDIAVKITWPKKGDDFIKVLGYCLKGELDKDQLFKIQFSHAISKEQWDKARASMLENTVVDIKLLKVVDIIKFAEKFCKETEYPSFDRFKTFISSNNGYYIMNEKTIESLYNQALIKTPYIRPPRVPSIRKFTCGHCEFKDNEWDENNPGIVTCGNCGSHFTM